MGNSQKPLVGVDIGGTKIEAVYVSAGVIRSIRVATPRSAAKFWTVIKQMIAEVSEGEKIAGIGIGVAGAVDAKNGRVIVSPNLRFLSGVDIASRIRKWFQSRVRVENDANCFLLAHKNYGEAKGIKNSLALTLGTGVGGAAICGGRLLRGAHGAAGEFGHVIIHSEKGKKFSAEDLLSSHAFSRERISRPESASRGFYRRLGEHLGTVLGNLVNIFDPEIIILGGSITAQSKLFLPKARESMARVALLPKDKLPQIVVSRLEAAGALGAAALFYEN